MTDFPLVQAAIEDGIARNLHSCVQIYVSVKQQPVLNQGFGLARETAPCDPETVMLWRSAGKPLTAAAICKAWEQGRLRLDDTVGEFLSEAACPFRDRTIHELLIHESGLPMIETGWPQADWKKILAKILATTESADHAAYQPQSTWFVLGEILSRIDPENRSFQTILDEDLLRPLGMERSFCGISTDQVQQRSLCEYFIRERGELTPTEFGEGRWLSTPSPGGNLRGPVSDLGRFYEMLLRRGVAGNGEPFLSPQTVTAMTATHRRSRFDQTLQHVIDMGLGIIVDSNLHGSSTVPYGFSSHCSVQTFGHGGSQCAMGFCDPRRELVVAWAANGFCGEGQHQRRNRAINEAVYLDLGFTAEPNPV